MDPLTTLGITLGNLAFGDAIKEIARDSAKSFAKDFFKDQFKDWSKIADRSVLERAALNALKEFLRIFEEEIDIKGDLVIASVPLKADLKTFLKNENIREILGRPFDPEIKQVDSVFLAAIWKEMKLTLLPAEFDWDDVGQQYVKAVRRILRDYGTELREILDSQNREATRAAVEAIAGVPRDPDLRKYRESLQKTYGYLKLDTLDRGFDHRMQLWKVFVPPRVQEGVPARELPKDFIRLSKSDVSEVGQGLPNVPDPTPALETLERADCRLVVLLGDPGSGKSTLVQYWCLRWAEEGGHQLPVLLELRKYASDRNSPRDFLGYLHSGASAAWQFEQSTLDSRLRSGNVLVIFDGLDEVIERSERETVMNEIARFSTIYNHARILVTSRITGYRKAILTDSGFRHFTLQDFNSTEISMFIERWHKLAFPNPDDRVRLSNRLKESINESQRIRELAANPLLLTLMAILNRAQKLPNERWELYARASEILLDKWDLNKFLVLVSGRDSISLKEKLGMLRSIADHMQQSPEGLSKNLIHRDQLEQLLAEYLESIGGINNARFIARQMMDELRERNFVLCFSGDEFYSFVHRTFLEYFCASFFKFSVVEDQTLPLSSLEENVFGKHWQEESWSEILQLIVGMIGIPRAKEIVEYMMNRSPKALATIFAAKCFGEVVERGRLGILNEELRSAVESVAAETKGIEQWNAIEIAVKLWGADERNLELVRRTSKLAAASFIWLLIHNTWFMNWRDDKDLFQVLEAGARSTDIVGSYSRAALQALRPNDRVMDDFLANLPPLKGESIEWNLATAKS